MHEASLAKQLLTAVLERAATENVSRIRAVRGWVAETEALDPDSLAFHFSAHGADTIARDARLDLRLTHVAARCEECQTEYKPEHHMLLCPRCNSTRGELLGPTGVGIDAIDVE